MKKIAAFFLLFLFSFNWFAYRFVFDYAQHKSNLDLEKLFDHDLYDESQLVELKIAMNLPYQTSRPVYERVDGEITIEGVLYKYVKRKVANDTLYLMCVPNAQKMNLETAKNDLFRRINLPDRTSPHNNGDSGWSLFKNLQNITNESSLMIHISSLMNDQDKNWLRGIDGLLSATLHMSPEQPPDC